MNYWLIKSEGDCYSIDDLKKDRKAPWTGVRNYQARNFMSQGMQKGDLVLFYHSNGTPKAPSGVYGVAKVASAPHADLTQFDPKDMHFEPKASPEKPLWMCVDMQFVQKFKEPITLDMIKANPHLRGMEICRRGSRLSVTPVVQKDFEEILRVI